MGSIVDTLWGVMLSIEHLRGLGIMRSGRRRNIGRRAMRHGVAVIIKRLRGY